jgi:integrase
MKVLFNHARRYDLFDRNPIELVRQSAKRRKIPEILTVEEIKQLLATLEMRERTLVFLALCTGLRKSELFALHWQDIDFHNRQIRVTRSIVYQVVGVCKTEASKKPVPLTLFWPQSCRLGVGRLAIEHRRIGSLPAPTATARSRTAGKRSWRGIFARSR